MFGDSVILNSDAHLLKLKISLNRYSKQVDSNHHNSSLIQANYKIVQVLILEKKQLQFSNFKNIRINYLKF